MSSLILNNESIRGITINNQDFKLLQYADDTTAILKDELSVKNFLSEIKRFGAISGLKVNTAKTKAIWLGNDRLFKLPDNIKWSEEPVKVLGVYVGWNLLVASRLTIEEKIVNIKKLIASWKHRKLTLNGKVLIIKSLALSQIIYIMNLLPFPDESIKEVENILYDFLWNGKTHKVKKSVIIQDFKAGGHNMADIQSMNITQKLKWIKLYLNGHNCLWTGLMEAIINVKNLNVFLRSDFDMCYNLTQSKFYNEVLQSFYSLSKIDQFNTEENLKNQFLFYNKSVKIGGELVFDDELFSAGLWRFCDLFEQNGKTVPFNVWKSRGVSKSKFIIWRALITIVRGFKVAMHNESFVQNSNKSILLPTNDIIDVQSMSSKEVYRNIVKLKMEQPTALSTYFEYFPGLNAKDVENMYVLPRVCTKDVVYKEFQYKILHKYLPTNVLLYKMKKVDSKKCTFCSIYNENIIHLFYDCFCVKQLWFQVQRVLGKILKYDVTFTSKDVILGYELKKVSPSNTRINNVILHVKVYLWKCKLMNLVPSYVKLKEFIEYRKDFEPYLEQFAENCNIP